MFLVTMANCYKDVNCSHIYLTNMYWVTIMYQTIPIKIAMKWDFSCVKGGGSKNSKINLEKQTSKNSYGKKFKIKKCSFSN